ncbi:MAG: methyltransferase domain-containing protein [Nitrospirota bacterium]
MPDGSRLLDLCCGTGHLAQASVSCGFTVVGIDGSSEMLSYAKKRVPDGEFITADAREFEISPFFDAAVSTFDSMNHILTTEDLNRVFRNVFEVLKEGGYFLFDLNMEEAFETQWHKSTSIIKNDNVCIISGDYDRRKKIGITRLTMFHLEGNWRRSDAMLYQKCHSPKEVKSALQQCGFREVTLCDARRDLKMPGHLSIGRTIFLARK